MREMKYSGVPWIGDIPNNWAISKIKYMSRLYTGNSIKDENKAKYEDSVDAIPYISSKDIDASLLVADYKNGMYIKNCDTTFKRAYRGDTLMCIEGGSAGIKKTKLEEDVCFVNKLCCFHPLSLDEGYQFFYLCSKHFEEEFRRNISGLIGGVSVSTLSNLYVTVPPLYEQRLIADFLYRKCADIDNVLEKTKASIEEYKKLKQSLITEAVTKGIRSDRPMKDSGSIWFGSIPSEWMMSKLKFVFTIKKRIIGEDGHTVLAITQKGIKPKDMSNGNGQFAESYANYQIVHPGDFAMNHMDLLTGWVDISKYEGVTSPDYRVFTLNDCSACSKYYLYMMQMCYTNRIFYSMGQGVSGLGRWRLPANMFNNFFIACPPIEEQEEIATYLDEKCIEIDSLIAAKEKFISELAVYKKSLIYEYVTGKKEVPNTI